ncbi:MAG: transglutaminase family protein [Desulfobulbaceae bacterium]|nr:transglutaminase family protein [Desulfobulbaceae bacterium]
MIYKVKHTTRYRYQSPVSLCHNIAFKLLADNDLQKIDAFEYKIIPEPNFKIERRDFFNNKYLYFAVQKSHSELVVETNSKVTTFQPPWLGIDPAQTPAWEDVANGLKSVNTLNDIRQFYLESPLVKFFSNIREYALQSFTPRRPIMEAMLDLNSRIYHDFTYTPGFTEVSTPLEKVFEYKKGVCQDFAHFGLACVRSLGLSAMYVSGYIETIPPKGKPKLVGSDASHAWMSLYIPELSWVEFDATNNLLVGEQHIRVAFGRDFLDVVPLKGIVYSGGGHEMLVTVDVTRL